MALTSLQAKALNAKRQSMYTPQQLTQAACNGRRRKLLATVDPDGTLTEAERNRRADALLKSQMLALTVAREMKRNAKKAREADQQRYKAESALKPQGCCLCGPLPPGAIDVMCQAHLADYRARLQRH